MTENELNTAKLLQIKILKYLHEICSKYNIKYFLAYGSLLGAIRHNGFIPWDDDIDVGMTRENYDRFVTINNIEREQDNPRKDYEKYSDVKNAIIFFAVASLSVTMF